MLRSIEVHAVRVGFAAALFCVSAILKAAPFTLWVTETSAGGTPQYNAQLKGAVRSYVFDGNGYAPANYSVGNTIPAGALNDPSAVTVEANGNLLISNRAFNAGVNTGSVARVTFAGNTPNAPTVTLAGVPSGPHQTVLTSTGGLIVSSFNSNARLYPNVAAPGTTTYAAGAPRGVMLLGNLLYTTNGGSSIQVYDVASGVLQTSFSVSGAQLLHYGIARNGALYVADIGNGSSGVGGGVFKVTLNGSGLPTASAKAANADGAISVAFSPNGDEMFVATHFSGQLFGFAVGAGESIGASPNLTIDGGSLAAWNGAHVQFGGLATTIGGIRATQVPVAVPYYLLLALGMVALGGWFLSGRDTPGTGV